MRTGKAWGRGQGKPEEEDRESLGMSYTLCAQRSALPQIILQGDLSNYVIWYVNYIQINYIPMLCVAIIWIPSWICGQPYRCTVILYDSHRLTIPN